MAIVRKFDSGEVEIDSNDGYVNFENVVDTDGFEVVLVTCHNWMYNSDSNSTFTLQLTKDQILDLANMLGEVGK